VLDNVQVRQQAIRGAESFQGKPATQIDTTRRVAMTSTISWVFHPMMASDMQQLQEKQERFRPRPRFPPDKGNSTLTMERRRALKVDKREA
jgi:hypothetical protein